MGAIWAAWSPTIVTLLGVIFAAGQLTGRIKGQEKTLARHDEVLGEHEDRLNIHTVEIAESKAWRAGYNAGKGDRN